MRASRPTLSAEIEAYAREACASATAADRSGEVPGAADARDLYKSLGLDPTKTRPSNEALLRRVLKGEALYRVNTLVDALNLASLRQQLPFGLYDAARLAPAGRAAPRRRRRGLRGHPQGARERGRPPGPRRRGRPVRQPDVGLARAVDHARDARALVVCYAPAAVHGRARSSAWSSETAALLIRHCGGTAVERALVPPA